MQLGSLGSPEEEELRDHHHISLFRVLVCMGELVTLKIDSPFFFNRILKHLHMQKEEELIITIMNFAYIL